MTMIEHLAPVPPAPTPIGIAFADWRALQEALVADEVSEPAWMATLNAAEHLCRKIDSLPALTADDVWIKVVLALCDGSELDGYLPLLAEAAHTALGLDPVKLWGHKLAA